MRLLGWSDLHVDYPANLALVAGLSGTDYRDDVLLVAGDISSNAEKLMRTLALLRSKFREVAFVPGNHDLWVAPTDTLDSLDKLHELHVACLGEGIHVEPFDTTIDGKPVRIVPLRSWYLKPEEGPGSLFKEKSGEDPALRIWMDNYRIKWPHFPDGRSPADHLLKLNTPPLPAFGPGLPAPWHRDIVSLSHFLPRAELIKSAGESSGTGRDDWTEDRTPEFNFSRVAGCRQLDSLLRRLGSTTHLYGHQHRNRDRVIDGVRYLSHCLGYPPEWQNVRTDPPRHLPLEIAV